ncbi:MAG: DUF1285 domain-containing protein [Hyphomicrobiales bacterium]|nr:DUF1285 domain-containing protein [Hyphomicrobiales bacterium]
MTGTDRIGGLAALLKDADGRRRPVERWNPPDCGDIGLRIHADGTWSYAGSPIGRIALVQLFASVLRREPDGRTYLVTPVEKVLVTVDDAPFLAVEMEIAGNGRDQTLIFRTNVDDVVRCGPENPLRFAAGSHGGIKPYVLVRGRLEALVTRALVYEIVEIAGKNSSAAPAGIWSGGAFFAFDQPERTR